MQEQQELAAQIPNPKAFAFSTSSYFLPQQAVLHVGAGVDLLTLPGCCSMQHCVETHCDAAAGGGPAASQVGARLGAAGQGRGPVRGLRLQAPPAAPHRLLRLLRCGAQRLTGPCLPAQAWERGWLSRLPCAGCLRCACGRAGGVPMCWADLGKVPGCIQSSVSQPCPWHACGAHFGLQANHAIWLLILHACEMGRQATC